MTSSASRQTGSAPRRRPNKTLLCQRLANNPRSATVSRRSRRTTNPARLTPRVKHRQHRIPHRQSNSKGAKPRRKATPLRQSHSKDNNRVSRNRETSSLRRSHAAGKRPQSSAKGKGKNVARLVKTAATSRMIAEGKTGVLQ